MSAVLPLIQLEHSYSSNISSNSRQTSLGFKKIELSEWLIFSTYDNFDNLNFDVVISLKEFTVHLRWLITVKDNPQLSDLKGPGTSKLDWRYFEYNKIDRNELQVRIYLHKGTGTKMTDKLTNLTEKKWFIFVPVPLSK